MWAAAAFKRRRSLLWLRFWSGSCQGFMLQPHETLVAHCCARIAVRRFDCAGDDLRDEWKRTAPRPIPTGRFPAASPIDLKAAQGYSAPVSSGISSRPPETEVDNFSYQSCSVTPANDSTFTNPETVPSRWRRNPGLRSRDTVIMTVDGQAVGQPGTVSYTMAAPVNRGTHTVSVTITDQHGRTVCSVSSKFHVMHPGLNSPAAPNRSGPTTASFATASHATLTTACTAGGQHGG